MSLPRCWCHISPAGTLLGTLSPGKDADVVIFLLSPGQCFEQDKVMLDKPLFRLLIWGRNDEGIALNAFESAWLNRFDKEVGLKPVAELCHELRPNREAKMLVQDEFITFELDHKARTKAARRRQARIESALSATASSSPPASQLPPTSRDVDTPPFAAVPFDDIEEW